MNLEKQREEQIPFKRSGTEITNVGTIFLLMKPLMFPELSKIVKGFTTRVVARKSKLA